MAEGDGDNDVLIKVGAEADTQGAQRNVIAEFNKMRDRLKDIATDEAQALAEQISAVTKGLKEGTVDPKSVEEVAAAFTKIEKSSELSDRAISEFMSKLKTAVDKSRSLSDYMRMSERDTGDASDLAGDLKDSITDVVPEARSITGEVGKWLNRIPGVNGMIRNMGRLAGGIALGFTAVVAAVTAAAKAMKEFGAVQREAYDRSRKIRDENAANAEANDLAKLNNESQRRQQELDHARAMNALNQKSVSIYKEKALYMNEITAATQNEREWMNRRTERRYAFVGVDAEDENIRLDEEDLNRRKAELEEKRRIEQAAYDAEEKRIAEETALMNKSDSMRSKLMRNQELRQQFAEQGVDVETAPIEILNAKIADWADRGAKWAQSFLPGNMDAEEAEADFEKRYWDLRARRQKQRERRQKMSSYDNEEAALRNEESLIAARRDANGVERDMIRMAQQREDLALIREQTERRNEMKLSMGKEGNRLTAMGLGSGNAAASPEKEIADNTRKMVGRLDSLIAAVKDGRSFVEQWRDGDGGATWTAN